MFIKKRELEEQGISITADVLKKHTRDSMNRT